MRKILSLSLPLAFLCSFGPTVPAIEGVVVTHGPTRHSLTADLEVSDGKKSFWLAWRVRRDEGWHTYWLHPGDVGLPPSVEWILPEGLSAGPLLFPPPKRVMMGAVRAHGHHDETLFLSRISIGDSFKAEDEIRIRAKIAWLACSKTCLPGYSEVRLSIPVRGDSVVDPFWSARFEEFRSDLPVPPPPGWAAEAYDEGSRLRLVVPVERSASAPGIYFFCEGRTVRSDALQPVKEKNGKWELRMVRADWSPGNETRLRGLLYRQQGWANDAGRRFYELDLPLRKP